MSIYQGTAAAERIFDVIDRKNQIQNDENAPKLKIENANINFENVSFKYQKSNEFLFKNMNFEIKKNQMIGIIGSSGTGKTTLLKILLGLIDPSSGKILLDNKLIKNNQIAFDKEKKIGAIGLRVKKWITYHGMSFNINPDLRYYDYIHSCGLKEYENTSMEELGIKLDQSEFDECFKNIFINKLKRI